MPGYLKYTWIPTIIALIIFYLCCLIPQNDIPEVGFEFFIPTDKLVHYTMYLGLSGATGLYYVYDRKGHINILKMLIGAIIIPILYGGLIEIVQWQFFPPRSGDWYDLLADALGSLTALPVILYCRKYYLNKERYAL